MTYHTHKVDLNHLEIKLALIAAGYQVWDLSASGNGVPDLLVMSKSYHFVMLEVKQPKGKLTKDETKFFAAFELAPLYVVRSIDEALEAMQGEDKP